MSRVWIGMCLCLCLLVEIATWKEVDGKNGSGVSNCSCYSFNETSNLCGNQHGNLVSMETLEEWKFIKTNIQNRTTNEWRIGLEKRDGQWTWMSNYPLRYDKWLRGLPHNSPEKKFVTIVKEFNGTQGLFNQTKYVGDHKGRIYEYHTEKNCSNDQLRWCRSSSSTSHPARNGKGAWNDTGLGPRYPAGCAVIKKQYTPVVIPILVALAGLLVIVVINVIIVKCKNATRGSSKKRDKSGNQSGQVDMDLAERTTIDMGAQLGIDDEKNVQPTEDCTGNSPRSEDEGANDIINIDASCHKTAQPEPYYVNVQGSTQQETLADADTNGHDTLVGNVSQTEGQNESFVVVRTHSIVCDDDDNIDGQTDDMNTANYATVSDTLGTREQDTLVTSECGYASVDVINGDSQQWPSGQPEHLAGTNAPHDESAQYAVVDSQKKKSKKHKTKQADNQNITDEGYAPTEVMYDKCQDVPLVQARQSNTQHTLADRALDAGTRPEYAVVNKSMKKKNRSVRETTQPCKTEEVSYASIDVKAGQNNTQRRALDAGTRAEYAVVNISMKKKNRSVRETTQPSKTEEASYASIDVKCCQEAPRMQEQRGSRRKNDKNESVSTGTPQVEYAAVDKSKKKNRSVENAAKLSEPTEVSHVSVNVECCQDGAPKPKPRGLRRKTEDNKHQTPPAENDTNAVVKSEYAVVDQTKNSTVKETAQPSEAAEASYASVDVICDNYEISSC